MLVRSLFGFADYYIGFISSLIWATLKYPGKLGSLGGIRFVRIFASCSQRFVAEHYYYGVFYNYTTSSSL